MKQYGFRLKEKRDKKLRARIVDGETSMVPEFLAAMIALLLMIATLAAVILGKKAWTTKLRGPYCPA